MYYNIQLKKMNMLFTYQSDEEIKLGTYCIVDYNNKKMEGIVVEKVNVLKKEFNIKSIEKVLDKRLDEKLFLLMQFIHNYYIEPYGNLLSIIEKPEKKEYKDIKENNTKIEEVHLSDEQQKVYLDIVNSSETVHLINGVTGSGKTQIYIKLIQKALKEDGSAILLVPEITLTSQLKKNLEKALGQNIALWHSKLTKNAKIKYFNLIEEKKIRVILGARSAIFSNLSNLKYIIIDEEHESTYKQDEAPRYHVKNVAIKRALLENAKVVLGSATPSFETMYQVKNKDIEEHILKNRYNGARLPEYIVKDISEEKDFLTDELIERINEKLKNEEQVILLLNRKAYSIILKCRDCKKNMECDICTFSLTYYKNNILKCNQCGKTYKMITRCKYCGSEKLEKKGTGTEKLEERLKEIFDEDRILRMDADSMTSKTKIDKAYQDFLNNKYDILIGTQILAKGFHFPNVTLVGILNADQMLSYPDYRAYERSYQLIAQASGRSGREGKKGQVFIQTYDKDSILIKSIITNDYNLIYEEQMKLREKLGYPPYKKHIKILFTDTNENRLNKIASSCYQYILNKLGTYAKIYPVAKCMVYKASKRYRVNINILYDRKNDKVIKKIIRKLIENRNRIVTRILVDVDPNNML
ncbi:primosomal protein N' [Sneathia sp. DSM 16630]|uniref:replication restart helicase PriA n=1 Tax=uncultured Sneathia sp. TaxID=278067 RepID=UPI002597C942|nr:primosomal protein N' [uncultured Sneathia sp.]MBE2989183.1 primosomal protein N' [Sneathia sp. DSM 16630]